MLANMASSLIMHKRIKTTVAKAKALRVYVEPLITKSKVDSTHSRRVVFSYLQDKEAVSELFREISGKVAERPGGYTRILKTGNRLGDNAEMCVIELVDYNESLLEAAAEKPKSSRRRRGIKKKVDSETTAAADGTADVAIAEEEESVTDSPEDVESAETAEISGEAADADVEKTGKPVDEIVEAPVEDLEESTEVKKDEPSKVEKEAPEAKVEKSDPPEDLDEEKPKEPTAQAAQPQTGAQKESKKDSEEEKEGGDKGEGENEQPEADKKE
jgi:large subunit ribosomal protein L17